MWRSYSLYPILLSVSFIITKCTLAFFVSKRGFPFFFWINCLSTGLNFENKINLMWWLVQHNLMKTVIFLIAHQWAFIIFYPWNRWNNLWKKRLKPFYSWATNWIWKKKTYFDGNTMKEEKSDKLAEKRIGGLK